MSTPSNSDHVGVSKDNHEAFIVITAILGLIWTLLVISIRLYLRFNLNPPFGIDDAAAVFGTIVGICQTSVTLYAVHSGIGKREDLLTPAQIETGLKSLYAASILYIVAICASKVSMSLLIARLTRTKHHLVASHVVTGFSVIWGITAVLIVAFQCSLPHPWDIGIHSLCGNFFPRWAAVESLSMFIEFLISAFSVFLVWNLFMPLKMKITVVGAFSLQLLVIVPTSLRLVFLHNTTNPSSNGDNITFSITNTIITTQIVMHFSLMAATFPCMRKFLQAFDLNMGATTKMDTELGTTNLSGSYHMKSMDRVGTNGGVVGGVKSGEDNGAIRTTTRHIGPSARFKPDLGAQTVTTITSTNAARDSRARSHGEGEARSIESDGSDQAIIRKTQQWDIRYERQD